MMAKISIFIPLYNSEAFITSTIQSVLSQTYTNWELIIIDDCSKDRSLEIAKDFELRDSRIKAFKNESNIGMMRNWNKGVELCQNEYFVKLDCDDIWHPQMLEIAVSILNKYSDIGLVFSKYININTAGEIIKGSDIPFPDFASNKAFSCIPIIKKGAEKMLSYPILRQGLSVMRRQIFDNIGNYKYIQSSDTEFYFRVGCHYKIYCIDRILYYYRVHPNSDTSRMAKEGLKEYLIYEVKNCILQYYLEQGKITNSFFNKQIKSVELKYNFFRVYNFRSQQKYGASLRWLCRNFYLAPLSTIKYYLSRL